MIFYFTGTGNSLATAQILGDETNDTLVDIGKAYKYKQFDFTMIQGQNLGFVFPVYAWSTPPIIDAFIKRATFTGRDGKPFIPSYTFAVISCGAFVGNTAGFFADELRLAQGINLDASFSVKSVGNCTYLYAPAEGKKRERLLEDAMAKSFEIAKDIKQRAAVRKEARNPIGMLLSKATEKDEKPRSTKEFYTLETCIGCGRCAEICPTNTITIIDDRPRWAEMGCTQCLACLHRCPFDSIQYGKSTESRGRFINPALTSI